LIDEISAGLQPSVIMQIAAVLRRERDAGTAMLLIEQNVAFALAIADRWAVLKRGTIGDEGTIAGRCGPDRRTFCDVTCAVARPRARYCTAEVIGLFLGAIRQRRRAGSANASIGSTTMASRRGVDPPARPRHSGRRRLRLQGDVLG